MTSTYPNRIILKGPRACVTILAIIAVFTWILFRLFYLQIIRHDHFFRLRERQSLTTKRVTGERGVIYDVREIPLAFSIPSVSVYARPKRIRDPQLTALQLEKVTGVNAAEILWQLSRPKYFVWIRRQMDIQLKDALDKMYLEGVGYVLEEKRYYPYNDLASHVLGFVGIDHQGLGGLEHVYDEALRGRDGVHKFYRDALGREIPNRVVLHRAPIPGRDLYLTLSKEVQEKAERALKQLATSHKINEGAIIAANARTGEILALASHPTYNPNNYRDYDGSRLLYLHPAVRGRTEAAPISFLIMSATALQVRVPSLGTTIFGQRHLVEYFMRPSLINSGILRSFAQSLGENVLAKMFEVWRLDKGMEKQFGGDTEGLIYLHGLLVEGKGVYLAPIHFVRVVASIVNGGTSINLTMIKPERNPNYVEKDAAGANRVIFRGIAHTLRRALIDNAKRGEGTLVNIPGYEIGGLGFQLREMGFTTRKGFVRGFVGFITGGGLEEEFVVVITTTDPVGSDSSPNRIKVEMGAFRAFCADMVDFLEKSQGGR